MTINDLNQAESDAQTALGLAPLDAECYVCLGSIHMKKEDFGKALDSFYSAEELTCPADPRIESIKTIIRQCQNRSKGEPATQEIHQAVHATPKQPEAAEDR
eukprot:UN18593